MIQLIQFLLTFVTTSVRSRLSLQTENAALRNQLYLYRRSGQRPSIRPADWLLWCFIAKFWAGWLAALYFVQPRTLRGLVTFYVLFIIRLSARSVHIAGVTTAPNSAYMKQVARNLTYVGDGFLLNSRHLIMDRDKKFSEDFRGHLDREGVKPVRCPARAPNCNAFAERFVRSIKDECLDRMILFGEASLRRALREYVAHYQIAGATYHGQFIR